MKLLLPYIVHLPLIFAFCFLLKKKDHSAPLVDYFWSGLALKLIAGIALGIIYYYHFSPGEDTFVFQEISNILTNYFHEDKKKYFSFLFFDEFDHEMMENIGRWQEPRTMFMVKVISILNLFTFNNYWINSLYFSLFAFTGIWGLSNQLKKQFELSEASVVFSFLFFPSFVFWSSGLMKDALMTGIICYIIFLFLKIKKSGKGMLNEWFLLILLFYFGWKVKFYYTTILGGILTSYTLTDFLYRKLPVKFQPLKFLILPSLFLVLAILASQAIPVFSISNLLFIMYYSYDTILQQSGDFSFHNFTPEVSAYIYNFPQAAFTGLFRPLPWETDNTLALLTGLENFVLFILFASCLFSLFNRKSYHIKLEGYAVLIYIILSAALMAFIAPNWGTLSRYKTEFLMLWVLVLTNQNILFNLIVNRIKKIIKFSKNHTEV